MLHGERNHMAGPWFSSQALGPKLADIRGKRSWRQEKACNKRTVGEKGRGSVTRGVTGKNTAVGQPGRWKTQGWVAWCATRLTFRSAYFFLFLFFPSPPTHFSGLQESIWTGNDTSELQRTTAPWLVGKCPKKKGEKKTLLCRRTCSDNETLGNKGRRTVRVPLRPAPWENQVRRINRHED